MVFILLLIKEILVYILFLFVRKAVPPVVSAREINLCLAVVVLDQNSTGLLAVPDAVVTPPGLNDVHITHHTPPPILRQ